jgi:hypothetical protein
MADMASKGRAAVGERLPHARLTASDVRSIRFIVRHGIHTIDFLADLFAVHPNTIKYAAAGRTWRHV